MLYGEYIICEVYYLGEPYNLRTSKILPKEKYDEIKALLGKIISIKPKLFQISYLLHEQELDCELRKNFKNKINSCSKSLISSSEIYKIEAAILLLLKNMKHCY